MKVYVAVVLMVLVTSQGQADDFKCLTPTAAKPVVDMPPLPSQFSVVIEANIMDQNATMDVTEYYDYPGNRGSIEMSQQGMTARILYKYKTNEIFTFIDIPGDDGNPIAQRSCDVEPLNTTTQDIAKVFSYTVGNKTNHIYSVKHVYDFGGPPESYTYVERSVVRGITVDHWYTCSTWTDKRSKVEVHWYYTASDWYSPILTSVPVRAHMRGHMINEEGKSRDIEHIYDFLHFRSGLPPGPKGEEVFQVPPATYCEGEVSTKPFPDLTYFSLYFRASVEILNPAKNTISHANIKYDQVYNLARFETTFADLDTNPQAASTYGAMVMIQDFNSGVQYQIQTQDGTCKINAIDSKLGTSKPAVDQIQMIRIASVIELLRLNQTSYTYVGTRKCRYAMCDVFVMLRDDWPYDNTEKTQTIWEWYFLTSDWAQLGATIPFQLVISQLNRFTGPLDPTLNRVINFINWDTEDEPDVFNDFSDIHNCFTTSDQLRHLRFELPAMDKNGRPFTVDIKTLKFSILDTIIGTTEISPLRIYDLQIEYELNSEKILVTFTLLDAPPQLGGMVVSPIPEPSVAEAAKAINASINQGKFDVVIMGDPEDPLHLVAKPISLIEVIRMKIPCPNKTEIIVPSLTTPMVPTKTTKPTTKTAKSTTKTATSTVPVLPTEEPPRVHCPQTQPRLPAPQQLTTGAVVGIGVGSAVGGALITAVIMFIIQWRIKNFGGSANFPMTRFK